MRLLERERVCVCVCRGFLCVLVWVRVRVCVCLKCTLDSKRDERICVRRNHPMTNEMGHASIQKLPRKNKPHLWRKLFFQIFYFSPPCCMNETKYIRKASLFNTSSFSSFLTVLLLLLLSFFKWKKIRMLDLTTQWLVIIWKHCSECFSFRMLH